jgi:hypothetical protein
MRPHLLGLLTLGLTLGASHAAEVPLRLSDPGSPLQEIRPLDRHVWILSLEGTWKQPSVPGFAYHVNLLFPNGASYSHRVLDDAPFRAGDVRCLIPEYQLIRNGLAGGGSFTIVVSARRTVTSATDPDVVSDRLVVRWPMDRPIVRLPPRSRLTAPPPIDDFPLPGRMIPTPTSPKKATPPSEPLPVPKSKT